MSNFTTTLRNICESEEGKKQEVLNLFQSYELSDFLTQKQIDIINTAGLWNKEKLAKLIVDEYYFREIGFETYGLFCHFAKLEMQKLMEYYLPFIYSMSIEYDPLVNVDFTETFERIANEQGKNQNTIERKFTKYSKFNNKSKFIRKC